MVKSPNYGFTRYVIALNPNDTQYERNSWRYKTTYQVTYAHKQSRTLELSTDRWNCQAALRGINFNCFAAHSEIQPISLGVPVLWEPARCVGALIWRARLKAIAQFTPGVANPSCDDACDVQRVVSEWTADSEWVNSGLWVSEQRAVSEWTAGSEWVNLPKSTEPNWNHSVRFQVLTAAYSLVETHRRFRGAYCLHHQCDEENDGGSNLLWNVGQYVPDYTAQHPVFILIADGTWNLNIDVFTAVAVADLSDETAQCKW
jgi:hypothetical protein